MKKDFLPRRPAVSVEVIGLTKRYGARAVFEDLSLRVSPGEIFVLMGPSGAGKSVFLKALIGLEDTDSGSAHINDINIQEAHLKHSVVMSLVFQSGALFNSMTVFDNLALYLREHRLYPASEISDRVYGILKMLSLEATATQFPSALSGGMRKRVAIARGLVTEPQLLLYDEPTSELDPQTAAMITEIIGTLRDKIGVTSIIVSHDKGLALTIADRVGVLMDGRLIAVDTPEGLRNSADSRIQAFLNPQIDLKKPHFLRGNIAE